VAEESSLAALLGREQPVADDFPTLRVFGLLELTCNADLFQGVTREVLARKIHEDFVQRQAADGRPPTDPALASWERLSEPLKDTNREQADDR
jgi:hypothetical protein